MTTYDKVVIFYTILAASRCFLCRKNTISNVPMDKIQLMGQHRYKNVRLGSRGNTKYTQAKRRANIYTKVATVGATDLPIPLRAAQKTSLMPQIK